MVEPLVGWMDHWSQQQTPLAEQLDQQGQTTIILVDWILQSSGILDCHEAGSHQTKQGQTMVIG